MPRFQRFIPTLLISLVLGGCRADTIPVQPLGQFTLFPRDVLLQEGMVLQLDPLSATDGPPLPGPIEWTSSDNAVATVDANGLVTTVAPGSVRITARSGPSADSVAIAVQLREGGSLEAFGDTNCGLTVSDGAVCWGYNAYGATGTRVAGAIVSTPTSVPASVTWRSIDGSYNHVCGVDTQFDIYCWGLNSLGQLGMGFVSDSVIPSSRVVGDRKFVMVSAGGAEWDSVTRLEINRSQQTCALTRAGEAFCWGLPGNPESSGETATSSPRAVAPGVRFASISVGNAFVCAITIERRAWCWGNNELGQLGRARVPFDRAPKPVDSELKFERVSAGGIHACALAVDGSAWCWGANQSMQLGSATTQTCDYHGVAVRCEFKPVAVPGNHRFTVISAGSWGEVPRPGRPFSGYNSHSCGVTLAQAIVCWGWNASNQVVQRLDITDPVVIGPTLVPTEGVKFRDVTAGGTHACAVSIENRGYCWFGGARGQQGVPPLNVGGFKALLSSIVFR
jgi:hypothetical protein